MDDIKHPKRFRRKPKNNLDGMLAGGGHMGMQPLDKSLKGKPSGVDFKRSEGFFSSNSEDGNLNLLPSSGAATEAIKQMSEEPVKEKVESKPKKSWFKRRKHHKAEKHTKKNKKGFRILRYAGFFVLLLIFTVGGLLGYGYIKARNVFKGDAEGSIALQKDVDPTKLKGEGDGRVNILLLGLDGEDRGRVGLTDTIIIASVDPINKEAALLSIPRDLWVKPSGNGSMRINSVAANTTNALLAKSTKSNPVSEEDATKAGYAKLEETIKDSMGIPIHYRGTIDFTGFQQAVDTLGGVTVNVEESLYENMLLNGKPYTLNLKTGSQQLNGLKALAFVRCRHCNPRSDFDRSERQRQLLIAMKDKALSLGTLSNPFKIKSLLDIMGDRVSSNMSLDELSRLYDISSQIDSSKIASIGLADPPNNFIKSQNINGASVQVPRAGVGNFEEIKNYIRNTLKDGFIKSEDAKIVVLNGSGVAGLATKTSEELKSYGYNVIKVGDAPTKDYTNTYIVDLTNGVKKYTKTYLEKRLGVTATNKVTDAAIDTTGADFVIIVGKNEATRQQN